MKGIFFGVIFFLVVTLVMPMIIVTSCDISIPMKDKPVEKNVVESDLTVTVYNHKTNKIMELELERYLIGVVAAETPAAFEMEALKAQAVAARTYAVWRKDVNQDAGHPQHPGAILCTNHQHCQEWLSTEELKERHGNKWMKQYLPKIKEAVSSTKGIVMTYNMKPIEPLYHSTSGGITENSEDVFSSALPYLRSVSSPYEEGSPVLVDTLTISAREFVSKMESRHKDIQINQRKLASEINILERTNGGSVKRVKVGNKELSGRDIRESFDLRSANFTVDVKGNNVSFTTKGYGHRVGMSQWGANGMAKEGKAFNEILKHYYQGVSLNILKSHKNR
ncbi:stage II sporulation protein D [Alkaliphilus oremlandii]|uniref:Sporulation stage II protein D firmicutes n=1 Tax=Alkaliphilus oremlandii (strain OhILAs) TaxID=350688 RepID=A8MJV3_ALKOO|nr:stage II sporulation protein D [Alkaliphilus oremlandii]ABW20085.1 Sporulation stage II protein D firmicutes [Alkaliphilus oremlandii OhILAs]